MGLLGQQRLVLLSPLSLRGAAPRGRGRKDAASARRSRRRHRLLIGRRHHRCHGRRFTAGGKVARDHEFDPGLRA